MLTLSQLAALPDNTLIYAEDQYGDKALGYFVPPASPVLCPRLRACVQLAPPSLRAVEVVDGEEQMLFSRNGLFRLATEEEQAEYARAKATPPPSPAYLSMDELRALPVHTLLHVDDGEEEVLGYFESPEDAGNEVCPAIRDAFFLRGACAVQGDTCDHHTMYAPEGCQCAASPGIGQYRLATAEEQALYAEKYPAAPGVAGVLANPFLPAVLPAQPAPKTYTKRKQLKALIGTGTVIYAEDSVDKVIGEVLSADKGECVYMQGVYAPADACAGKPFHGSMRPPRIGGTYRDATPMEEVAIYRAMYPADK